MARFLKTNDFRKNTEKTRGLEIDFVNELGEKLLLKSIHYLFTDVLMMEASL